MNKHRLISPQSWKAARKNWILYLFIGIFAVLSLVFGIYPMICSVYYSLFKTNTIFTEPVFVGL